MYLIDTNFWIEHFKNKNSYISSFLQDGKVIVHDFIIGELSLGSFNKADRNKILDRLKAIERVPVSRNDEVLQFIEDHKLQNSGIGFIDAHLLHACFSHRLHLATLDQKLEKLAEKLKVSV